MKHINRIRFLLNKKLKVRLLWMTVFSILISFVEMLGVSIIMPFIGVATDFNIIQSNKYFH